MNFKKLLSAIGLLAVGTPATLSVVACGQTKDNEKNSELDALKENVNEVAKNPIIVDNEDDAKTKITDTILSFNKEENTLTISVNVLFRYVGPTHKDSGSILGDLSIKNEENEEVAKLEIKFKLELSQKIIDQEEIQILKKQIGDAFSSKVILVPDANKEKVESHIENEMNKIKEKNNKDSNLALSYTFTNFQEPTKERQGMIFASVTIKSKSIEELEDTIPVLFIYLKLQ